MLWEESTVCYGGIIGRVRKNFLKEPEMWKDLSGNKQEEISRQRKVHFHKLR